MTIKNVKLNDKELELYALIYSKYSKDIDQHHANRRKQIMFRRLNHETFVGGITLLTIGFVAKIISRHFGRRCNEIDDALVDKLNSDPEIQKMFELEDAENVSAE
jgi:hypothetical protein